jgi:hypothetical protein
VAPEPTAPPPPSPFRFDEPVPATPLGPAQTPAPAERHAERPREEPSTGEYRRTLNMRANPRVLPWVITVGLVLVFVLSFFSWVGVYPGGVSLASQSAWQAAFGGISVDKDLEKTAEEFGVPEKPGANVLLILFLLLFFLPVLLLSVFALVWDLVPLNLPPALQQMKSWRWGLVGMLDLVAFLFLGLQLLVGFSLENKVREALDKKFESQRKAAKDEDQKKLDMAEGIMLQLRRTFWLRLSVFLLLLVIVCAALDFWISRRGKKPLPRLQISW